MYAVIRTSYCSCYHVISRVFEQSFTYFLLNKSSYNLLFFSYIVLFSHEEEKAFSYEENKVDKKVFMRDLPGTIGKGSRDLLGHLVLEVIRLDSPLGEDCSPF